MTEFELIIRRVTSDYRRTRGLPPLEDDITLPVSICEVDESVSGWPFCRDGGEPRMIAWNPQVVINGVAEPWNPNRKY